MWNRKQILYPLFLAPKPFLSCLGGGRGGGEIKGKGMGRRRHDHPCTVHVTLNFVTDANVLSRSFEIYPRRRGCRRYVPLHHYLARSGECKERKKKKKKNKGGKPGMRSEKEIVVMCIHTLLRQDLASIPKFLAAFLIPTVFAEYTVHVRRFANSSLNNLKHSAFSLWQRSYILTLRCRFFSARKKKKSIALWDAVAVFLWCVSAHVIWREGERGWPRLYACGLIQTSSFAVIAIHSLLKVCNCWNWLHSCISVLFFLVLQILYVFW